MQSDSARSVESSEDTVLRFEQSVEALIAGDLVALRAHLDAHPELTTQRSTRSHRSTLLHYVSANGVEDDRQITPDNIVAIAELLLVRGADVNATSDAYGGGSSVLGLVSTSAHPRAKGVQIALIDLLLAHGARRADRRTRRPSSPCERGDREWLPRSRRRTGGAGRCGEHAVCCGRYRRL